MWAQLPGLLTRIIPAMVSPRKASRETRRRPPASGAAASGAVSATRTGSAVLRAALQAVEGGWAGRPMDPQSRVRTVLCLMGRETQVNLTRTSAEMEICLRPAS